MITRSTKLLVAMTIITVLLVGLPAAFATGASQNQQAGLRGEAEAVGKARDLVQAMGGQSIWAELRTLHLRHRILYVGAPDKRIEDEYYDLVGPRKYSETRSEIYHQQRASGPGIGWISRNGVVTQQAAADIERSVKGAPGAMYRIVRRIAANDPTLEVRGNANNPHRLEFYDASGLLCWIHLNVSGEPVVWGRPEVEWVWGPLKPFGSLRVPAWGAYTNGSFRIEMLEVKGSREPFSMTLEPPAKN